MMTRKEPTNAAPIIPLMPSVLPMVINTPRKAKLEPMTTGNRIPIAPKPTH